MKFYTIPKWTRCLQKGIRFQGSDNEFAVYFTFDDGPDPESLPQILDILNDYEAKATFFCLGEKLEKHPDLWQKMQVGGHQIANHGYKHLDAFRHRAGHWLNNALQGRDISSSDLFRPPYGHMRLRQKRKLLQQGFKIIFWDLMLYDYHAGMTAENMWQIFRGRVSPGSIIVLHDKGRTIEKLKVFLPRALEHIKRKGWEARILTAELPV